MMGKKNGQLSTMNRVIAAFCADVANEPLCFFSEGDIQGMLYARLVDAFPARRPTGVPRGAGAKSCYKTGLVHREYGAGAKRRTDVCVFGPNDIGRVDSPNLTVERAYLDPLFAVELGTEKTKSISMHIKKDIAKLQRAQERGYAIHFYRDMAKSNSGSRTRAATNAKIENQFKAQFSNASPSGKVRCLGFVIRIGRSRDRLLGKCEMYDQSDNTWQVVNLKDVERRVLGTLED